ncbi:MAG TPA: diguanylate cyclase [Rhodanobacteraceae bacterium]|nr:diguanylate cyclase [Rhodanobacteraceae bacterium]
MNRSEGGTLVDGSRKRAVLLRRVARTLESAHRRDERCLLLRLQVTGLDDLEDRAFAATVSRVVTERMRRQVRVDDLLVRSTGHEFTVLAQGIDVFPHTAGTVIATRLAANLTRPYGIDGVRVDLGVRIGIASFPDDAQDAEGLLLAASQALRGAHRAGEPWRFAAPQIRPERRQA